MPSVTSRSNTPLNAKSNGRLLVPFHQDTPLWPYPRAPLDDRDTGSESDVVELDFADTSALSDMAAFDRRIKEKEKEKKKNGKGKEKKSKKEREEENAREREEIEQSWDAPALAPVSLNAAPSMNLPARSKEPYVNGAKTATTHMVRESVGDEAVVSLDRGAAAASVLSALGTGPRAHYSSTMKRSDFVRELLTTIHVSRLFPALRVVFRGLFC